MHSKKINVLIGTCGAPGASTLIRYVKKYQGVNKIHGYDADHEAVGRFYLDGFINVKKVTEKPGEFISELLQYVKSNRIDVLCVCSSLEVEILSHHASEFDAMGCLVLVSPSDVIQRINNKRLLYEDCRDFNLCNVPDFRYFSTREGFESSLTELAAKHARLCVKPSFSKGKRGFRRISDNRMTAYESFFTEKPSNETITSDELIEVFSSVERFPEMLIMEEVEGLDVDTMALSTADGEFIGASHKTRERDRGGVIDRGELFLDIDLNVKTKKIVEHFGIKFLVGIQFKGDCIIEINPRFSSFIFAENWCDVWIMFDLLRGVITKREASEAYNQIPSGIRMTRYFDQVFHNDYSVVG